MKSKVLSVKCEKLREIELPKFFNEKVREDILVKAINSTRYFQPHAPFYQAGNMHSASGIVIHKRKVWKTAYGHGISRVPRKIFSRDGTRFNWEAAAISSARGGRRAHHPTIEQFANRKKINKKEMKIALISALLIAGKEILVFEDKLLQSKVKEIRGVFEKVKVKKPVIIKASGEKAKIKMFDIVNAKQVSPLNVYGRNVVYTEKAIDELEQRIGGKK